VAVLKAKPEKIVDFFLAMVGRELLGPDLITRVSEDFFKGAQNDTVSMRIGNLRAVARDYEFRTRTAPIVLDDIEGGDTIPITLDRHVYSATGLTDEHLTLDNLEFATDVLVPQVEAVVGNYESKVVAAFRAAQVKHTVTSTLEEDPHLVATEARRLMNSEKVAPYSGRIFLVGSDVEAAWLTSDRLSNADNIGNVSDAVRDAVIGRLAGAPVVVHPELNPSEAYYFHKSSFVMGSVAPVAPRGAVVSAKTSRNGYAARWLMDYDSAYLRDRSVVSSFIGINEILDERVGGDGADKGDIVADPDNVRIVKLTLTGTGSVLTP
jgi:hypothetical protein